MKLRMQLSGQDATLRCDVLGAELRCLRFASTGFERRAPDATQLRPLRRLLLASPRSLVNGGLSVTKPERPKA